MITSSDPDDAVASGTRFEFKFPLENDLGHDQTCALELQEHGNLVIENYHPVFDEWDLVWESGSTQEPPGKQYYLHLQLSGGNLVIYEGVETQPLGRGIWSAGTGDDGVDKLYMNKDCTLSLEGQKNKIIWKTTRKTRSPTFFPSITPSITPTEGPSSVPTLIPTSLPSLYSSKIPSTIPSHLPSVTPSYFPSTIPTNFPSKTSSQDPTSIPSLSSKPTLVLSVVPSLSPTNSSMPSQMPLAIAISLSKAPTQLLSDTKTNLSSTVALSTETSSPVSTFASSNPTVNSLPENIAVSLTKNDTFTPTPVGSLSPTAQTSSPPSHIPVTLIPSTNETASNQTVAILTSNDTFSPFPPNSTLSTEPLPQVTEVPISSPINLPETNQTITFLTSNVTATPFESSEEVSTTTTNAINSLNVTRSNATVLFLATMSNSESSPQLLSSNEIDDIDSTSMKPDDSKSEKSTTAGEMKFDFVVSNQEDVDIKFTFMEDEKEKDGDKNEELEKGELEEFNELTEMVSSTSNPVATSNDILGTTNIETIASSQMAKEEETEKFESELDEMSNQSNINPSPEVTLHGNNDQADELREELDVVSNAITNSTLLTFSEDSTSVNTDMNTDTSEMTSSENSTDITSFISSPLNSSSAFESSSMTSFVTSNETFKHDLDTTEKVFETHDSSLDVAETDLE